ncbi:hypothetical protein [Methanorbis furvi]|uniref:Uncharacterized protein n=1 Tax=Methanorbis furvi TaxID=3028299 RepID=A0AAE4MEE7_9EURY|nr:hypothetical protein [Methanocorpusculaceae archaeon Ag1]
MVTKKAQIACRLSPETLGKVKTLIEKDDAPFESMSEYLYTLIISDLARREMGVDAVTYQFFELLKNPEIQKEIKRLLKD